MSSQEEHASAVRKDVDRLVGATAILYAILALVIAVLILQGHSAHEHDRDRIADNAETAQALCSAAEGARNFWVKVRLSTIEVLKDKGLSPIERSSNEHFKAALTEVIAAAHDLARSCTKNEK